MILIKSDTASTRLDADSADLLGMVLRPRETFSVSSHELAATIADAVADGFWPLALVSGSDERKAAPACVAERYPIVVTGLELITPSACWLEVDDRIELLPMTAARVAAILNRRHVVGATIDIRAHPDAPLIDWLAEAMEPALGWRAHLACL